MAANIFGHFQPSSGAVFGDFEEFRTFLVIFGRFWMILKTFSLFLTFSVIYLQFYLSQSILINLVKFNETESIRKRQKQSKIVKKPESDNSVKIRPSTKFSITLLAPQMAKF